MEQPISQDLSKRCYNNELTYKDLENLEKQFGIKFDNFIFMIDPVKSALNTKIDNVKSEFNNKIETVEKNLQKDMSNLTQDFKKKFKIITNVF